MGKTKVIELAARERTELEDGYRNGKVTVFANAVLAIAQKRKAGKFPPFFLHRLLLSENLSRRKTSKL